MTLKERLGTSLVVQWLRIHLPMQGAWVRSLVRELSPHALELSSCNERSCVPRQRQINTKKKKKRGFPSGLKVFLKWGYSSVNRGKIETTGRDSQAPETSAIIIRCTHLPCLINLNEPSLLPSVTSPVTVY